MSHFPIPTTLGEAPTHSQPLLQSVKDSLGSVPNLFRLLSHSPAALNAYLQLNTALGEGQLDAATRERLALAVSQQNDCQYCLAAHSYLGKHVAKLSEAEILTNRHGSSGDEKAAIAVNFAVQLVQQRGAVQDSDIQAVLDAGYSRAELLEIIAHVALNTLSNYVNTALATEIDFPAIASLDH